MTVGILTHHWKDDYGTMLQAYAIRRAVENAGHEPLFIDLCLPYASSHWGRIAGAFRHRRFEEFRRVFLTPLSLLPYRSMGELRRNPPLCDCYLTAGPFTWNPSTCGNFLPAYFLAFGPESTRRIAYAPSSGLSSWADTTAFHIPEISRALGRFSSILLAAPSEAHICKDIFGHHALQVVEPILLLDDYLEVTGPLTPGDEIVTYLREPLPDLNTAASLFCNEIGLPLHEIGTYSTGHAIGASRTDSVRDWVSGIAEARMVITDSPSALALALIYHRPFAICLSDSQNALRVYDLLTALGLKDHIIHSSVATDRLCELLNDPIDWKLIDLRLGVLRSESRRLLRQALS
ncbi:MAG: polysaccharide pyruvyl transferase family protein [Bacteroidales bacterium]|nr:polysaccharide pyruvyl transferase family protein [Bacteroidales bacterium]MDE7466698.1 polysaccharide pyruvyl transferase family protein [Muribaculaceae bacterium]